MTHKTRGTTLIELLVVISVCSVVMCASGVLLHGMYRADKEARLAIESAATVARLSLQFRRDAHAAGEARLLTEADGIKVGLAFGQPAGSSIEYRRQGLDVVRTAKETDKAVHRDSFRMLPGTNVAWQLEPSESSQTPVAAIQISRVVRRGVKLDPIPGQRIEAVVGLMNEGRRGQ